MKVFFLTNIPAPYRIDFFNELGKFCDLTVLFEKKNAMHRNDDWLSYDIKNFKAIFLNGMKIGKDAVFCSSITKWIKKDKFDLFIVGGYSTPTGMYAIELLKFKRIKFVLNCDGGFVKNDNFYVKNIKKHFIGSAYWWLSSGGVTNKYLEYYGAKKERIFEYPFTSVKKEDIFKSPADEIEKKEIRKLLGIKGKKVVVSVGSFINRKGFDVLIKAWIKMPLDYELLIIGGGPEYLSLHKIISENSLNNVKLIDFKKKDELKKYYRSADLFVLPTREDIWGLVVNEAMAYGLPVITTNKCIAGLNLIENYKNGFITEVDDEYRLYLRIKELLDNDELIRNISKNNLLKIQSYTIEEMAKKHKEIFNSIVKEKSDLYV